MEAIQWKSSYNYTRNWAKDAYLSTHPLMLQAAIARTQHLMKKLATQLDIGRLRHYQQCLPHPLKMGETRKYY